MDAYGIKPGYRCNLETVQPQYTDEASLVFQKSIYEFARDLITARGLRRVLDVGCGKGLKLDRHIRPTGADITGVDEPVTIGLARARHDFGTWISDDIETPSAKLGGPFDLVISVDVIEHLTDPDCLLDYMRTWAAPGAPILLSTPERDLRRGPEDMGPPKNRSHVREWNKAEFAAYLTSRGMTIDVHHIAALRDDILTCQLVLCRAGATSDRP